MEYNFVYENNLHNRKRDFELIFGEDEFDTIIWLTPRQDFLDILLIAEIYPSKSRARKDGWKPELPQGFYDKKIGNKRTRITVWNPTQ